MKAAARFSGHCLVGTMLLATCLLPRLAVRGAADRADFLRTKNRDAFFIENDLVYSRFLELMRDGSYLQINKDRVSCVEADRGTWEVAADGNVRLHSTRHALRCRALLSGPLDVVLDDQEKRDHLTALAAAIRRFLASSDDAVFDARSVAEYGAPPAVVVIDHRAETYSRADLLDLLRQIDDDVSTENAGTYTLTPVKAAGTPQLLVLRGAVFQAGDLGRVLRQYHVKPNTPPPFYFAQVDARTFAREVGTWETFRFLGGTE